MYICGLIVNFMHIGTMNEISMTENQKRDLEGFIQNLISETPQETVQFLYDMGKTIYLRLDDYSENRGWFFHTLINGWVKLTGSWEHDCINRSDGLTKFEQEFAEKNHDLVFRFMNWKQLDSDTYYDVVVLGYLKAVKDYWRKESARKYDFRTIAFRSMLDALYKYWRAESTDKRKLNHIASSLDAVITDEGKETNFYDIVPDRRNEIEDFETGELISEIKKSLSDAEKVIFSMLLNGYKQREIQQRIGMRQKDYNEKLARIRTVVQAVSF